MAPNSTPRRRFGVALGVILPVVTAGLIGFTGNASAHTPKWSAECDEKTGITTVTVKLTAYNGRADNTVKLLDGETELVNTTFRTEYRESFETDGSVDHVFKIDVKAHDGEQYNLKDRKKVKACVEPSEPPSEPSQPSEPPSSEPSEPPSEPSQPSEPPSTEPSEPPASTEAPPAPTTTAPPTTTTTAEVEEAALAETGASIALPLGIAGALLVGGAGALFFVRRRSSNKA